MRYHFDVGNTNVGPLGFSASIEAPNPLLALEKLRGIIEDLNREIEAHSEGDDYLCVYFNPDALRLEDIDTEDLTTN